MPGGQNSGSFCSVCISISVLFPYLITCIVTLASKMLVNLCRKKKYYYETKQLSF